TVEEAGGATIEERALSYLKVLALECILSSPESLRITDLTRQIVERLGVPFDEHEAGGLAAVVRLLLDSDPRFGQSSRRWDLALRMGRADADRKKPVERSIEDFIDLFGVPARAEQIAALTAAQYGRDVDYFRGMIERLAPTRPQFFVTPDG